MHFKCLNLITYYSKPILLSNHFINTVKLHLYICFKKKFSNVLRQEKNYVKACGIITQAAHLHFIYTSNK